MGLCLMLSSSAIYYKVSCQLNLLMVDPSIQSATENPFSTSTVPAKKADLAEETSKQGKNTAPCLLEFKERAFNKEKSVEKKHMGRLIQQLLAESLVVCSKHGN